MSNTKYILIVGMPNSGKTTFNTVLQHKILEAFNERENFDRDLKLQSSFVIPEGIEKNYKYLEQKEWPNFKNYNNKKLDIKEYPNEVEIKDFSGDFLDNLKSNKTYYSEVKDFHNYLISDSLIGIFLILDSKILFDKKDYKNIDSNFSFLFSCINNKEKLKQANSSTTAFTSSKKSFLSLFKSNEEQIETKEKLPKVAIIANKLELFSEPITEKQLEERFANIYTESYKELQKIDYKFFNVYPLGKIERNINGDVNISSPIDPKNIIKPIVWLDVAHDYTTIINILNLFLFIVVTYSFLKSDSSWIILFWVLIIKMLVGKYKRLDVVHDYSTIINIINLILFIAVTYSFLKSDNGWTILFWVLIIKMLVGKYKGLLDCIYPITFKKVIVGCGCMILISLITIFILGLRFLQDNLFLLIIFIIGIVGLMILL